MTLKSPVLLTAAILFGLVFTAGVMFASFQFLVEQQKDAFDEQSRQMAERIKFEIADVRDEIGGLATAFYAAEQIDSDSLHINSTHIFSQHKTITTMLYAPIVKGDQRRAFEIEKKDEGFISFAIHDLQQGKSTPSAQRPRYLPITQVEPFNVDNISLLGVDLFGEASFQHGISDAIRSGDDVAMVAALGAGGNGLWLFRAIYAGFSGQSDPYFSKHSVDMVNGMVGIKADISKFIDLSLLPDQVGLSLAVRERHQPAETQAGELTLIRIGPLAATPIWLGLNFSSDVVFPLKTQDLVLHMSRSLSWLDRAFLLFFLSGMVGLGFSALLVLSFRALLNSEQRNRAILGSAMDAIININEHGLVQEFNPAAEQMFGYPTGDAVGKDIADLIIPASQRAKYRAGMAHYLATGEQHVLDAQLELTAMRSNGDTFPIELNIIEVLGGNHRLFTAFLRDISARKKAQEEVSRLATVVEQSFNAIIVTDTKGITQYVNPAYELLSGYSSDEALGKSPGMVKSGEHSEAYYTRMWQTLASGKNWSGSFINKAKDGHMYHVEQTIFPLYVGNEHVGYTAVQQDVTERDRLQEQSEHTQRLESLGVLAGGIAHDFNNLLSIIMGNAGLAEKKIDDCALPDDALLRTHVHNILHASESAATLCQQMLAYSGKGRFVIRPLNLSSIIADIVQLLESSIAKLARLDIRLDYHSPAIDADESQMKQVIMNLVINASEAIGDQAGHIHVRTSQVRLDTGDISLLLGAEQMQPGDYILLQVKDNGCGMDEETRKKIFDPFFTTKFTGRGLGMSAILGIIRGHHGGLKVTSNPGKGTCFDVYFPASEHAVAEVASSAEMAQTEQVHATVLVVDDESALRELASMILQDMGLKVLVAADGVDGLEVLQKQRDEIDLILLDMTMPRMGGEEFYKQMRTSMPDLPVIVSSGYAEEDIRSRFEASERIDFVQKPYHPEKLADKVASLLSKRQPR